MTFGNHRLPPQPEHLRAVLNVLCSKLEPLATGEVIKESGLTRTQTYCALSYLAAKEQIKVIRQSKPPKTLVLLIEGQSKGSHEVSASLENRPTQASQDSHPL